MSTDTEVGLKETARNLLGCFNNEAKANYQESPAVFTGKRASVVEEAEEEMDEGAIRISGVCQSSNEKKNKQRNKMQQLSLQAFHDFWSFTAKCLTFRISTQMTQI